MLRSTLLALSLLSGTGAQAVEMPPAMSQYIYDDLMSWINDPQIVEAVAEQNLRHRGLAESDIIARDTAWRSEIGRDDTPTIDAVIHAPLSAFLREHVARSQGRITEVFVMDNNGLNVGASSVTSDYWQGDEAKFRKTYFEGSGAVFIDQIGFDESTQTYQGQVSFALTDPKTGIVVGAVTVGLNANAFY